MLCNLLRTLKAAVTRRSLCVHIAETLSLFPDSIPYPFIVEDAAPIRKKDKKDFLDLKDEKTYS